MNCAQTNRFTGLSMRYHKKKMSILRTDREPLSSHKYLFVKHLMIRILIAANFLMLFAHYAQNQKLDSQLSEAAKPAIPLSFPLADLPPIVHEAVGNLVAKEIANYHYDFAWENWAYLQSDTRKFVIETLADDIEKIDSVDSRIAALENIMKLPRNFQLLFSEKYNRFDSLNASDPFDEIAHSYYDLLVIQKWQVRDEMQYLAYVNQRGLAQRYCLRLRGKPADQKKFCEYLMDIYTRNAKMTFGYHMLVMYFVNWPSEMPITYDPKIPVELFESALVEAVKCLLKHGLDESVDNLEKYLNN